MLLKFNDYLDTSYIDYNALGEINESHKYSDSISSVMDKLTFYVKRNASLYSSTLNESAKRMYDKDIRFNRDEKIAVSCIFNEMLKRYEEHMRNEISLCESIINNGYLLEEGVEYDYDELVEKFGLSKVGKWFKDKFTTGTDAVKNTAKEILDDTKEITSKSVKVVKAKANDIVSWAKQAKKEYEERYKNLKKLIDGIVKKGVESVKDFINAILETFTSFGDNLVDAIEKLGGLDDDSDYVELDGIETEGLYKNIKNKNERSFVNQIIIRAEAMLTKDKENTAKMMTESYDGIIEESIVDNKFIAWLSGYKSNGVKMSWWKSILIGLSASLIVWMIPHVLGLVGIGAALSSFIAALVGVTWNGIGMLKLIYRRNKERKPGEKFFDKKTAIFFTLCVLCNVFAWATLTKTIAPLLQEICNTMGWTGGDDMSEFGKIIFNITKKISPKDAFHPGGWKEWSEEIQNHGGDVRNTDIISSKDGAMELLKKMPGASQEQKDAFDNFLSTALASKGSTGVYKALEKFSDSKELPFTSVFDTSKWGGSGPILKAIKQLKDAGQIPDSTILGTLGSETTTKASKGVYGFANYIIGANKEQSELIFKTACDIAGKDMETLQIHNYGTGIIQNVIIHRESIKGFFDVLAGNHFIPVMIPFFDKKMWGKYKMRFASATRGSAAYVVDKVEMIPGDKIESDENNTALNTLKKLHSNAWDEYQKLFNSEKIEEGFFGKKKEKNEKIEEPQYIAFYINESEDTGNKKDKPNTKEESNNESVIGVVIDTLTMMCADVCNFNKSVEIRRRPQPYFMKGLLSRLSFSPCKKNDNETKDYIRVTLGQSIKTLITQNVLYGMGKKYIDSKVDDKEAEYTLRETVVGSDSKINPDKNVFELGNFTPNELLKCLSDDNKDNKIAYSFLDGQYGTKVSIKTDENGEIKSTKAVRDAGVIENLKYYRVSKADYNETMETYEKNLKKYKEGKLDKKPRKPSYIKSDGNYYKRASKKFISEHKRKKIYDFVDVKILPLLKKGELYKSLIEDDTIKKVLYTKDEETEKIALNKKVVTVLKPYLFRPEKTFKKEDEHELTKLLKEQGVEGEKLGWFKNLIEDEEQLHDTFKKMVEIIWDYLSNEKREMFKNKDLKKNHGKTNEGFDTLFDELVEECYVEDYDDDCEYEYDMIILNEENKVIPSYTRFITDRY